jgi:hypothetical protein
MVDQEWERYGALGGIWFVVLMVIGGVALGTPPSRSDSAAEIAKYYADKDTALQVGAFLAAIGIIGLVWWFATLWRKMAAAEGGTPRVAMIALLGFLVSGIGAMMAVTIDAATAAANSVAGEGSAVFFQMSNISFGFSALGDVILTAAVGGLVLRTGFLPKWVAYLSAVVAAVALVGTLSIASDSDAFTAFTMIGALLWGIWIIVISILNFRSTAATN